LLTVMAQCGVIWRGFTHARTHREVLRYLLRLPPYAELVFSSQSFAFKYLIKNYLAQGFSVAECVACFLYHYQRLQAALPDSLLRRILKENVTIHEIHEDSNRFILTMGKSKPIIKEGELSLHLRVEGKVVFILSFTIVPGWVVNSQAAEILLVSRIQGVKGAFARISLATKTLHDVAPDALLFAALQGVANAFGIGEIVSVSSTKQSSYIQDEDADFKEAYDGFFAGLDIPKDEAGFFHIPLPFQEKPLVFIKTWP